MHATQKFYRVFVSSTYEDLKEERNHVFDALLKSHCFPVGMEHFPGSDARSLDLIKKYIDQCDYFLVLSAGMYGSLVPDTRVGYTEWEYDYALNRGIPCHAFVHGNLGKIPGDKLDTKYRKQLDQFHTRLKSSGKEVKSYENSHDLGAKVLHAFQNAPLDSPAVGWVRARREPISNDNRLVGAWQLVSSNKIDWNQSNVIKVYTENEFVWFRIDLHSKKVVQLISGTYSSDSYQCQIYEKPRLTSPKMSILDTEQVFEIVELTDTMLKTQGELSNGVFVEEEFTRIDWQ